VRSCGGSSASRRLAHGPGPGAKTGQNGILFHLFFNVTLWRKCAEIAFTDTAVLA
jgi:hypothetical protein